MIAARGMHELLYYQNKIIYIRRLWQIKFLYSLKKFFLLINNFY